MPLHQIGSPAAATLAVSSPSISAQPVESIAIRPTTIDEPYHWWQVPAAVPATISSLVAALALIITALFSWKNLKETRRALEISEKNNKRTLLLRSKEERVKRLHGAVEQFLAPLQHLLETSKWLYLEFRRNREEGFRTLTYLVTHGGPNGLSDNEKLLLKEILSVSKKVEALIYQQFSLIRSAELRKSMSNVTSHYRLMRLAYAGKLKAEKGRDFNEHVFPRGIQDLLRTELQEALKDIQSIEDSVD